MPGVAIVDTSVLLNVLDVPAFNQDRDTVLGHLEQLLEAGEHLLLPMAAIFEAGNHIGQLADGRLRRRYATEFADQIRMALNGNAPWVPVQLPDMTQVHEWLDSFPDFAMRGSGMGDLSIVKEWEAACARHPRLRVRIWSLDHHMGGYDRAP